MSNRDSDNKAGNHVAISIDGRDSYVLLAHLLNGSVTVKKGDQVRTGDLLARIGNSGNTTEPHLPIYCTSGSGPEFTNDGEGIPISFGGKFLVRNSLVVFVPR